MEEDDQLHTYVTLSLEKEYPIPFREEDVWCVMFFTRKKSDFYIVPNCIDVQDDERVTEALRSMTSLKRESNTNPKAETMFVTL